MFIRSKTQVDIQTLIQLQQSARVLPLKTSAIRSPYSGGYVSLFKGRGMEFDEVRAYQAGDDIRHMDWRVTARQGKPHTKLFREERERAVFIWVDYTAAMFFATQGCLKSVLATYATSLLAWASVQHQDRLGGLIFSETQHIEQRPMQGKTGVLRFLQQMVNHSAWQQRYWGQTDRNVKEQALLRLRRVSHPGSLIFLVSDFRYFSQIAQTHLVQLSQHNDLVLLLFADPLEVSQLKQGSYRISNGRQLKTITASQQNQCQQRFSQREKKLEQLCQQYGMHLLLCMTHQDILEQLKHGLVKS